LVSGGSRKATVFSSSCFGGESLPLVEDRSQEEKSSGDQSRQQSTEEGIAGEGPAEEEGRSVEEKEHASSKGLERREVRKSCVNLNYHAVIGGMAGSVKGADFFDSVWVFNSFCEVASWVYEIPDFAN
jgi:hypothetical protein